MFIKIREFLKTFIKKIKILFKVFIYIYKIEPVGAVLRTIIFIASTFLTVYLINLGGEFIDTTAKILKEWTTFSFSAYLMTDSFFVLLKILIVTIIQFILKATQTYITKIIKINLPYELYNSLIDKIRSLNLEEVENKHIQDLITYSSNYSFSKFYQVYNLFTWTLYYLIQIVLIMVILFNHFGWNSFLLILIALPEVLIWYYRSSKLRVYIDNSIDKTKYIQYLERLAINNRYFPELRVDNIFKFIRSDRDRVSNLFQKKLLNYNLHRETDFLLFRVIDQILIRGFIIFIVAFSILNQLTIGTFSALIGYSISIYEASVQFFTNFLDSYNFVSYVEKFFDLLDFQGFGDREPGAVILKKKCPTLEFQNLDFMYPGTNTKILENISFQVFPGEKIAIIGGDGSGKSTLAKLIGGLYKITAGDYFIDTYSIRELARGELKKKVSIMYQDFVRYNLTLKKNITIGGSFKRPNASLYKEALKITGLDRLMKTNNWNDNIMLGTLLGNGIDISPGYWQRLAIARTIYRDKPVIVMDEPFTFIDELAKKEILDSLLKYITADKIFIYITQNSQFTDLFDRVYKLEKGLLKEIK